MPHLSPGRRRAASPVASVALAALALAAVPALAHHGWAWTEDAETRISGTIEAISFGNPHMTVRLRAGAETWQVDLSPPIVGRRSGFGPEVAAAGDSAVLTGHRARDGSVRNFKAETITVRGVTYDVYPQREKTLTAS